MGIRLVHPINRVYKKIYENLKKRFKNKLLITKNRTQKKGRPFMKDVSGQYIINSRDERVF